MLESNHALVVKGLQLLYKHCVKNEGFPGEPLAGNADGYPLTHAILDRLGLIKQAEENPEDFEEESEDLQYLKYMSTNSAESATTDPSPEPATPPEPASSICSPVDPPKTSNWDYQWAPPVQSTQAEQQQQQHSGMIMPRLSPDTTASLGTATDMPSCTSTCTSATLPSAGHDTPLTSPYMYYAEDPHRIHHQPMMMSAGLDASPHGQAQAQPAAGLPIDVLNAYQQHLSSLQQQQQQQQPMYAALATGWTFPLDR